VLHPSDRVDEGGPVKRSIRILLATAVSVAVLVATAGAALPATRRPTGPTNINVSRFHGNQSETAVAVDQTDPSRMTITSNLDTAAGLFHGWSTDGGRTWQTNLIANGGALGSACCDSSMASDEFGNIWLTYIANDIRVALSIDGGATFHAVTHLDAGRMVPGVAGRNLSRLPSGDQPSITAGNGAVWVTYTLGSGVIQAAGAAVTGLGQVGSFSTENANGPNNSGDYGDVSIGPDGQVMIAYQNPTGGEGPATIYGAVDPDGLGPQGLSPSVTIQKTNVGGFDYIPAQAGRSVDAETELAWDRTGGPHEGRVYLLYTSEFPDESNDMDINVRYSDDDGATWSPSVRVNDDTNTFSQFNPRFSLDPTTGNLAVAWYDCRNDTGTHGPGDTNGRPNDDAIIYGAVSRDGGVTFSPNERIGAGVSNSADAQNGIDFGDYEGLTFFGGAFYPVWADNSNSTGDNPDGRLHELDVYTARIKVS
jgi:hypothetical protein